MTDTAAIIAALLALALIGTLTARDGPGRILTYGGSFLLTAGLPIKGFQALTAPTQHLQLPLGLPWIATNLRLDALSGFFLILIGLGGAGASLFALGYGRHEAHPERVPALLPRLPRRHGTSHHRRRRLHLPICVGADVTDLLGAGHGASP